MRLALFLREISSNARQQDCQLSNRSDLRGGYHALAEKVVLPALRLLDELFSCRLT